MVVKRLRVTELRGPSFELPHSLACQIEPHDFVSLLPSLLFLHQTLSNPGLQRPQPHTLHKFRATLKMINAFLVFNNAGQPRLTKFYTQLVRPSIPYQPQYLTAAGNLSPTTSHLRNIPTSIPSPDRLLQLPASPTTPRSTLFPTIKLDSSQRRTLPRNLPSLRHLILHNHLHVHRKSAGPH